MKSIYAQASSVISASALALLLLGVAPGVHAIPFTITSLLTGDIRLDNPDNLIANVTIQGDTTSNQTFWTVDINSPAHVSIKLDEFYFNMAGLATSYTFNNYSPADWVVNTPASVQGAGGTSFMFETQDTPGPPNAADVTNAVNLSFTMTYGLGSFTEALFLTAPVSVSNDAGSGQLGAHLQSLTVTGNCGNSIRCSDSGFAFGRYINDGGGTPPQQIPEPGVLLLLGAGLMGLGLARRPRPN